MRLFALAIAKRRRSTIPTLRYENKQWVTISCALFTTGGDPTRCFSVSSYSCTAQCTGHEAREKQAAGCQRVVWTAVMLSFLGAILRAPTEPKRVRGRRRRDLALAARERSLARTCLASRACARCAREVHFWGLRPVGGGSVARMRTVAPPVDKKGASVRHVDSPTTTKKRDQKKEN
nr:hypothetical protein [Pandoravirus massiliensis]